MFFGGMIIIAANAGVHGRLSVMLLQPAMIGGQITAVNIIKTLILPSIIA